MENEEFTELIELPLYKRVMTFELLVIIFFKSNFLEKHGMENVTFLELIELSW